MMRGKKHKSLVILTSGFDLDCSNRDGMVAEWCDGPRIARDIGWLFGHCGVLIAMAWLAQWGC